MTQSAKQDTTKAPAEPAATESAATQAEAQAEAQPEVTAESVTDATTAARAEEAEDAAKPDLDETKRKFREALERKHQAHSEGQGKGGRDDQKINGAHGPAASRRSFRRKSG
jgi:uncharacterized protein DUF5302